ncbi:ATP-dependent DNA helicase RecG [Vagococcus salmoninarum]|uniref:ATP-dependent DNA helicase RecG n=1 Tax=Vagococcus salmoninarum TaxID=2739 RepID=A0A429ZQV2_9ENTE|nr:ATP-dependent DNA helicase RecG [Vagococcus salmoninarum]MBE9387711.1 ATP-dependent DNA helicase RecG [Vagococcus salmoninarum]RST96104.1 ATP-dependent DNA helicase RecG [Vagococcus salmoninarum]
MKKTSDSIQLLPGVGPKRGENLEALGLFTVEDVLTYYPFRYDDIQEKNIAEIGDQEKVVLKGTVIAEGVVSHYGYRKNRLSFRIMHDQAVINVTFFNQAYLKDKVVLAEEIAIFGKWDAKRKALSGMKILGSKDNQEADFAPIYHLNKKVRQGTLVELIKKTFELYGDVIEEWLPPELLEKYRLYPRKQAMYAMHFPEKAEESQFARRRIVFEEFFEFQMQMQQLRYQEKEVSLGLEILYDVEQLKTFTQGLPFDLTDAQKRVTNEICRDMRSSSHMHRLLQGDVGSGKTVVAAIVMYAAYTAGFQSALMVPTEILAEQHLESLTELFADFPIKIALLTGSTKAKERREILAQLAEGSLDVLIGTHALIQKDVEFKHLGLVITDEQHRFGVNQRKILRDKGDNPDVLFMTATPIPRTLAITAYGEMDVSIIDELPKGRIPIETRWIRPPQLETVLTWTEKELARGSQAYVICPLIEESETIDVKNATEIYETLQAFYGEKYQVGLLHGKMKSQEKDEIMTKFKDNQLQVLVSTTVIEVGVNVPNATTMLIMDADRFGLAQLHQLRGRVGRGNKASYCVLVANPKNEMGSERMKIMTETTDGFVLSQKDLEMRGPGEVFGSRQSGIPQFAVGDIVADFAILEAARQEAVAIWDQPKWWQKKDYQGMCQRVLGKEDNATAFD